MVVDDILAIQVKKLTRDLRTVNFETTASRNFDLQLPLEGFPGHPRLTLGHKLDEYGTELSEILLIFSIGNECQWHYDLRTGEATQQLFPFLIPDPVPSQEGDEQAVEDEKSVSE